MDKQKQKTCHVLCKTFNITGYIFLEIFNRNNALLIESKIKIKYIVEKLCGRGKKLYPFWTFIFSKQYIQRMAFGSEALMLFYVIDWGLTPFTTIFISRRPVHLRFLVFSHQYSTQQSFQATG